MTGQRNQGQWSGPLRNIHSLLAIAITAHWTWTLTHPAEGIPHLFPWTRAGMQRVIMELWQGVRYQRLPPGGPEDCGLAGFMHGLGLLVVTAAVTIGGAFFITRMVGAGHDTLELIENVHDVFAVAVWVFWGGHLAAVVLHSLLRQPVWRRMFR